MKRVISLILICILCLSLIGCVKTYRGTDALIEKAREEIPISDADTIDMQYAGMCGSDGKAIAWFISGNKYQMHYYLPMEIEVDENSAEYTFVRTYKPIDDRAQDIAYIHWNNGYAVLINNPDCKSVRFTSDNGVYEETIQNDAYPYVFFYPVNYPDTPNTEFTLEYAFLDVDGNELR